MPRGLAVAATAFLAVGALVSFATSKEKSVTMSGRAYVFNHSEQGIAGATIRVRELPKLSAITDANGDYELEIPDGTNVTPYIEPPDGYNEIDLQTFHTRGRAIPNANFQTPADAEYNGLAALLQVPIGPDGRPEQCVIVTTASARNVRGVDFETFQARTPHGVPGATARTEPALPGPIYFNENVIPDRSRTETSGDGGIIWTEVPAGRYRVITESESTRFASVLATCKPGRIVNANPPWGAYELTGKEEPLGAGIVAASVEKVKATKLSGERELRIEVDAAEPLKLKVALKQGGDRLGPVRRADLKPGTFLAALSVARRAEPRKATVAIELIDRAGDSITQSFKLRLPAA